MVRTPHRPQQLSRPFLVHALVQVSLSDHPVIDGLTNNAYRGLGESEVPGVVVRVLPRGKAQPRRSLSN